MEKTLAKFTYGFFSGALLTLPICVVAFANLSQASYVWWSALIAVCLINAIAAFSTFFNKEWE